MATSAGGGCALTESVADCVPPLAEAEMTGEAASPTPAQRTVTTAAAPLLSDSEVRRRRVSGLTNTDTTVGHFAFLDVAIAAGDVFTPADQLGRFCGIVTLNGSVHAGRGATIASR